MTASDGHAERSRFGNTAYLLFSSLVSSSKPRAHSHHTDRILPAVHHGFGRHILLLDLDQVTAFSKVSALLYPILLV